MKVQVSLLNPLELIVAGLPNASISIRIKTESMLYLHCSAYYTLVLYSA